MKDRGGLMGVRMKCGNCDCCYEDRYCEGCDMIICFDCYDEHNNDAPCHTDDDEHDENCEPNDHHCHSLDVCGVCGACSRDDCEHGK